MLSLTLALSWMGSWHSGGIPSGFFSFAPGRGSMGGGGAYSSVENGEVVSMKSSQISEQTSKHR